MKIPSLKYTYFLKKATNTVLKVNLIYIIQIKKYYDIYIFD